MDGARRAARARQRLPLAAGAQDVEDGVHRLAVVHPRAAARAFLRRPLGNKGPDGLPHGVRHPIGLVCFHPVIYGSASI